MRQNPDKLASYPKAIQRLQREGHLAHNVEHRILKYLNNFIEAYHGALKRMIRPTRGFQRMKTAFATIKGFEVMRMIRRGHCVLTQPGATGEIRLVTQLFGLAASRKLPGGFAMPLPSNCNGAVLVDSAGAQSGIDPALTSTSFAQLPHQVVERL